MPVCLLTSGTPVRPHLPYMPYYLVSSELVEGSCG
jgi:hypothetical protein